MFLVAGVNPFRAVAGEKIFIKREAGNGFEHRNTVFFSGARVDGGFIDDDVALFQGFADGFRGLDQGSEIRAFVLIDGGGHGDDIHVAGFQSFRIGTEGKLLCASQLCIVHFQGGIVAVIEGIDARLVDVEANHRAVFPKFHR